MQKTIGTSAMQPAPEPEGNARQQDDRIDWARRYAETHNRYRPPEAGSDQRTLTEAFFTDLWGGISPDTENIIIRKGGRKISRLLSVMQAEKSRNHIFCGFWDEDLYYSPNSFMPCGDYAGDARRCNLYRVISWAIDVDYKKGSGEQFRDPLSYYYNMLLPAMDGKVPVPNWIEYGHCLRMVYILQDPISMRSGKAVLKGLEAAQQHFVGCLNGALDCHAEAQPVSSYYRVPGSHNSKDASIVQLEKGSAVKWTAQELMGEYLPDLPYTKQQYDRLKRKKGTARRAEGKTIRIFNNNTLLVERLAAFERLRAWPDAPREKLTFLYGTTWRTMYPEADHDHWIDALRTFNAGFPVPLKDKEITSKFRTLQIYKYKNSTICRDLGLTEEILEQYDALCLLTSKRDRQKAAALEAGETRSQKTSALDETIWAMYQDGRSNDEIAATTGKSPTTVRNHLTKLRKQHGDTSRRTSTERPAPLQKDHAQEDPAGTGQEHGSAQEESTQDPTQGVHNIHIETGELAPPGPTEATHREETTGKKAGSPEGGGT